MDVRLEQVVSVAQGVLSSQNYPYVNDALACLCRLSASLLLTDTTPASPVITLRR